MRLYYIDKPGCHHITKLIPGIFAIYQMQMEFFPYLSIEFLPHRDNIPAGILLITKDEIIRRFYTFDTQKDVDDLRNLIWTYLKKDHNIEDISQIGYVNNFYKLGDNEVIQTWDNIMKKARDDNKYKIIMDKPSGREMAFDALHQIYKLDTTDEIDNDLCKKLRGNMCYSNFPAGSDIFKVCMDEAYKVCDIVRPGGGLDIIRLNIFADQVRNALYKKNVEHFGGMNKNSQKYWWVIFFFIIIIILLFYLYFSDQCFCKMIFYNTKK